MKKNRHSDPHSYPLTRRGFLSQGIIGYGAFALSPTLIGKMLLAANDESGLKRRNSLPTLVFDLAGGAGLPGNFLVGGEGGSEDLLKSYDVLGWNPREANSYDRSLGLPMAIAGQFRTGILQTASKEARRGLTFAGICHHGQDDSFVNPLSPLSLIGRAGLTGKFINKGLGTTNTSSGGNSVMLLPEAAYEPLFVQSVDDLVRLVGLSGGLVQVGLKHLAKISKLGGVIGSMQAKKYEGTSEGLKLATQVREGYAMNEFLAENPVNVDARRDPHMQKIYGISANSLPSSRNVVIGSLVFNTLKGHTGAGVITIGGCDYHTNSNVPGDAKDLEIGQEVGRAVEAAYQMQVPLYLNIITDGGVVAEPGTRNWTGDSGVRSLSIMGYYHPSNPPALQKSQVGYYNEFQAASSKTFFGAEPAKATAIAFGNWLSIQGRVQEFSQFIPEGVVTMKQLEQCLVWGE